MDVDETPLDVPSPAEMEGIFNVFEFKTVGEAAIYEGRSRFRMEQLREEVQPLFQQYGYEVSLHDTSGSEILSGSDTYTIVGEPASKNSQGVPWSNLILFIITVISTLVFGALFWYDIRVVNNPVGVVQAWPFSLALMGILGIHELGHWALSRYHGVDASLPYFIPIPSYIGTLGAVIRMRGPIPSRQALFDIGVAGPLAGLIATVFVTAIGLHLDPVASYEFSASSSNSPLIVFHNPPLLEIIAAITGTASRLESGATHPVVFAGWVGMFVTFLNLLPVGQLDGGHISRSLVGKYQHMVANLIPLILFALATYLLTYRQAYNSTIIWVIWGILAFGLATVGPATPIQDESLGLGRTLVGLVTFTLGALCFTPIPVEIVPP